MPDIRVATTLQPLLAAALPWLELGLGLDRLAIAAHSDTSADEALRVVLETVSATYTKPVAPVTGTIDYDVFISYSHKNTEASTAFVSLLRELRPDVRVFVDRDALEVGMAWQDEIYGSLERSRYVVALLSPEYLESKNCQREFGMADLHGDRVNRRVLRRSTSLRRHFRPAWSTSSTSTPEKATPSRCVRPHRQLWACSIGRNTGTIPEGAAPGMAGGRLPDRHPGHRRSRTSCCADRRAGSTAEPTMGPVPMMRLNASRWPAALGDTPGRRRSP